MFVFEVDAAGLQRIQRAQNVPSALNGMTRCSSLSLNVAGTVMPGESCSSIRLFAKSNCVMRPSTWPRLARSIVAPLKMMLRQSLKPMQK